MISEKQLAANRRNAELSTGPRTEEGKRRCALNARRHGITGQVSAMTEEDRLAHDRFSEAMLKDLAPEGALETQLAQRVATDSWRLNRISAIEDNLFALGFDDYAGEINTEHPEMHAAWTAAKTFQVEAKNLQLLSLYEQRLNRGVQKNLAILQDLQTKRKASRQAAMEEVKQLCQVADSKGRHAHAGQAAEASAASSTYEANGFVFSIDEIRAAIHRDRRLERAQHLHFRRHKHQKPYVQAA